MHKNSGHTQNMRFDLMFMQQQIFNCTLIFQSLEIQKLIPFVKSLEMNSTMQEFSQRG